MSEVYLCPICDYSGITKDIVEHFKLIHNDNIRENPYIYTRSTSCKPLDIFLILAFESCFVLRSGYSVFTRKFTDNVQMLESDKELLSNYKFCLEVQSKNGILIKRKFVQPYNFFDLSDENSITTNSDVLVNSLDIIDNLKFTLSIIELKKIERTISLENQSSLPQVMVANVVNEEQSVKRNIILINSVPPTSSDSPLTNSIPNESTGSNISTSLNVSSSNLNENMISSSRVGHLPTPAGARRFVSSSLENYPDSPFSSGWRNGNSTTHSSMAIYPSFNHNQNLVSASSRVEHVPSLTEKFVERRLVPPKKSDNLPKSLYGSRWKNISNENLTRNSFMNMHNKPTGSNICSSLIGIPFNDNETLVAPLHSWRSRRTEHLPSRTKILSNSASGSGRRNISNKNSSSNSSRSYNSSTLHSNDNKSLVSSPVSWRPDQIRHLPSNTGISTGHRGFNISINSKNIPDTRVSCGRRNISNDISTSNSFTTIRNKPTGSNIYSSLVAPFNDNGTSVTPLVSWRSRRINIPKSSKTESPAGSRRFNISINSENLPDTPSGSEEYFEW